MALDGKLVRPLDSIDADAKIEVIARDDPRALELIRHDAAHVLAEAVQCLWPGTQVTIGPVIENGFYYDFVRKQPFAPEDFHGDRKEDARQIARDRPFTKEVWTRDHTKKSIPRQGRILQGRTGRRHSEDQPLRSICKATGSTCAVDRT